MIHTEFRVVVSSGQGRMGRPRGAEGASMMLIKLCFLNCMRVLLVFRWYTLYVI